MRYIFAISLALLAFPAPAQEQTDHSAAEQRWAAKNAAGAAEWRVVAWGSDRVACQKLSDFVPGATTPEEALAVIRQSDPDAYANHPAKGGWWER